MGLNRYETEYFENLVAFNEAIALKERNHFYERLSTIKANGTQAWGCFYFAVWFAFAR
jgi:hypothetical protein